MSHKIKVALHHEGVCCQPFCIGNPKSGFCAVFNRSPVWGRTKRCSECLVHEASQKMQPPSITLTPLWNGEYCDPACEGLQEGSYEYATEMCEPCKDCHAFHENNLAEDYDRLQNKSKFKRCEKCLAWGKGQRSAMEKEAPQPK